MLFYNKIVPLNRDRHKGLRLRSAQGKADFAANTHYLPLAGTEFYQASRSFPILFTGGEGSGPVVLVGLQEARNLFLDEEQRWDRFEYVPAYVRRYPFVLAKGDNGDDYTVCFDEAYAGFNEAEGEALFDEEGKDSPYLQRTIRFLNQYLAEMERTKDFIARLEEWDLLKQQDVQIRAADGSRYALRDFKVVDEEKLNKIADGKLGELHREGWLGWIYAHLISLNNLAVLSDRIAAGGATEEAVNEEAEEA
ncbi:SapC family protein [Alkalilimnicola ehrlichii]|uniref:SapC family protein n=2 Tax=Alkalilimnicola ehrlichii TaxID=351052 RepID=A0A3E0WRQ8_9GAMM|nr:SapC family protein [Alkalilimnicola ehrlichii]RFA35079.1 SapC family protein [Alkalilimnicola ehrlichii]